VGRTKIVLGLCLLLGGVACGGDDEAVVAADSGMPDAGSGGVGGSGGTGGSTGGSGGTGGAGTGGSGGTGGTAGMEPDEDGGVEETVDAGDPPTELPNDGERLSVCTDNDDCTGDDLSCTQFGTNQGFCAQDCSEDDDCDAIDGIEAICDLQDRCVIDCGEQDGGAGECPDTMVCVETPGNPLDPTYRCQYPEVKNADLYEVCDVNRDDADCMEGLTCQLSPSPTDPRDAFCAMGCEEASDCDDLGSDATPVCDTAPLDLFSGTCALECEEDDNCPGDLECLQVDLIMKRCGTQI
jgi:hypothetical protein